MKRLVFILSFASLMMLSFAPTHAVSEIVLDDVTGLYSDDAVNAGCSIEFTFRLTNTDGNTIYGFCNGFRVWTHRYGAYTNNFGSVSGGTLPLGWDTLFDLAFSIHAFSVDGMGEDTVGFSGARLMGPGIADGFDQQVWWVRATPYWEGDGDTLCIDSSWFPPGGSWLWATTPGGTIYPTWYGPHCFSVYACPCGPPHFTNCVDSLIYHHCDCDTAEYTFCADDPLSNPPHYPLTFKLLEGPGMINQISDTCAVWSYVPSSYDYGTSRSITVEASDPYNCGICTVDLIFANDAPVLTGGCGDTVTVSPGHTVQHQMSADSVDCDPLNFYIAGVSPQPSIGSSYGIDNTGLVTYNTSFLDSSKVFRFDICVADELETDCCSVYFHVTGTCCQVRGNADGQGGINVADLAYLVSYLFDGGLAPPCYEEGNADGEGGINVADLTYLVDYLFFNGPAPPPCP